MILIILLAGAAAAAWLIKPEPPVHKPLRNLTMAVSDEAQLVLAWPIKILSMSRDGKKVAYLGTAAGKTDNFSQIYIRSLDQPEAMAVPNAKSCSAPCFSPDGEWVVGIESLGGSGFRWSASTGYELIPGGEGWDIVDGGGFVAGSSPGGIGKPEA